MVNNREKWDRAIASLNFNKFNQIPSMKKLNETIKKLNSKDLRIVGIICENGILFEKRKITYEEVGKMLDKWIIKYFNVGK